METIGIIGYGNMGSAIAERIACHYTVCVFEKEAAKTREVSGIRVAKGIADLTVSSDAIILAVKPQDFRGVLEELQAHASGKLVMSIAAGKTTAFIEGFLPASRVVRVMPNLGAKIGKAETCLCRGQSATDGDLASAQKLFDCIGKTWLLDESMLDSATAITGSGPAYIFYDMEVNGIDPRHVPEDVKQKYVSRLRIAACDVGFDRDTAVAFASSVTATACDLAAASGIPVAVLRSQVTSKGGTTAAALERLARGESWSEAARAAKVRAQELSREFPSSP